MRQTTRKDILWALVIGLITATLIFPKTRTLYINWNATHPYLLGFFKFALLATMGEILAKRLVTHTWIRDNGLVYKIVVWGIIGIVITFIFPFYSKGVAAMVEAGGLPTSTGWVGKLLKAFYTSALMNLSFGPVFMAAHRISDTYIDQKVSRVQISIKDLIAKIDWGDFITFVVGKTIPLIWIPAHTLTFLLPSEYRVLTAAYLSIVLGVILSIARIRKNR